MGIIVAQQQRILATIKADAAASNSIPDLKAAVEALIDQVQKLKDNALGKSEISDD